VKKSWLPKKPKTARKCGKCNGSGQVVVFDLHGSGPWEVICGKCGGKGFR